MESQQKKAAAMLALAELEQEIAKKKEFLAGFGITDFTPEAFKALDIAKIDAEWVRRRDEAAMAEAESKSTSRAEEPVAAANATPAPTSGAPVLASSQSSSDGAAPMTGTDPVVEGPSSDEHSSSSVRVDRARSQSEQVGAMAETGDGDIR